jgi:hypothetical protein
MERPMYRIEVKPYMTREATENFDFMAHWNNNKPMPLRVMRGTIEQETNGMYFMILEGHPEPSKSCMMCGKKLTHPVSLLYGLGPQCGEHWHINPFSTKAELDASYEEMRAKMKSIVWTGWVIKKALVRMEKIQPNP